MLVAEAVVDHLLVDRQLVAEALALQVLVLLELMQLPTLAAAAEVLYLQTFPHLG